MNNVFDTSSHGGDVGMSTPSVRSLSASQNKNPEWSDLRNTRSAQVTRRSQWRCARRRAEHPILVAEDPAEIYPTGGSPFDRGGLSGLIPFQQVLGLVFAVRLKQRQFARTRQCYTMIKHRLCLDAYCERRSNPAQHAVICFILYQEPKGILQYPIR